MIALSCPRPEVNGMEKEDINQNPFVKSFHSFKGIAQDFWNGVGIRRENALDSPYDFVNYWTFGATDGILSGAKERKDKMFESKSDFANYATFGFSGMVKEAVSPEESFSKEHWLNSFGLAGSIFGVGKLVPSPGKKSGTAAVDSKVIDVTDSTIENGIGKTGEGISKGTGNIGKEASEAGKHVVDVKIPENMKKWDYPPSDELYKKYENVYKNPKYYNQKTGEIHWPPNDGFVSGTQKVETLQPGTGLDRYGNPAGSFLAPESDSFPSRALAPHSEQAPYYVYEVIDDFEVTLGKIAPWFDQPGGGTQIIKYKSNGRPYSIEELIELEVIKQINS